MSDVVAHRERRRREACLGGSRGIPPPWKFFKIWLHFLQSDAFSCLEKCVCVCVYIYIYIYICKFCHKRNILCH